MSGRGEHPYASFIHRVKKPAQYLGGEHGEVRKDWSAVRGRMCLAFPDLYEVGMSHLGYRILYGILNRHPELLAERAYAPWSDLEAELRQRGEPLRSLETWRPLRDFDVVGFSLQFELTYTNVLLMLDLGGIPLRAASRGDGDPLVLCGGPVATHAEPLADFVDAFLIGDGEERTPEIVLAWATMKADGVPRQARLRALANLQGVYVPSLYRTAEDPQTGLHVVVAPDEGGPPFPVRRTFVPNLAAYPFPHDSPVPTTETVFDRMSIEIARGCTEGCRFCQAGMIYRPVRERPPTEIVTTLKRALQDGGYEEASLTSLSTADYSAIAPLVREVVEELKDTRTSISVSSLRAYGLSEDVLDDLKSSRAGGLTFAPEAGTQRMRDVVNKNVTEAQLLETARRVFSRGWDKMKLYFMIGLPTEEDEDVLGIVETGAKAQRVGRVDLGKSRAQVVVSVSTHVPKPHTPFQWCAMDTQETVDRKQRMLRQAADKARVKLRLHDSSGSWLEGVLARGDRTLAAVLEGAYRRGARFDSWTDAFRPEAWAEAFEEHHVDTPKFLGTLPVDARLPWDHLDVGLEPGFLAKEYRKALRNRLSPPCGKAVGMFVHHTNVADAEQDKKKLVCYDCGVACDLSAMRTERLVFLRSLGADVPRQGNVPAAEANPTPTDAMVDAMVAQATDHPAADDATTDTPVTPTADPTADAPAVRKGIPKQARFHQGHPVRVRLRFRKVGRLAWGSHLDLVKLLPRMMRRANLPLFYSEGFNPRPVMVFGQPLPVGVAALSDYVDVKLDGARVGDLGEILAVLQAAAFEGFSFTDAAVLGPNDRALSRVVDTAVYVAALPHHVLTGTGLAAPGALAARIAARQAEAPLTVERRTEGITRRVVVSDYLLGAEAETGHDLLAASGLAGDLVPLQFTVRVGSSGGVRPSEVIRALLGDDAGEGARFVRAGLFARAPHGLVTPMELEALRASAPKPTPLEVEPSAEPASFGEAGAV